MIKRKLAGSSGMSVVFALAVFLLCTLVSSFIVDAALTNTLHESAMREEQQAQLAAASAARYLRSRLEDMKLSYVLAAQDGRWQRVYVWRVERSGSEPDDFFILRPSPEQPELNGRTVRPELPSACTLDAPRMPDADGTRNLRAALCDALMNAADGKGRQTLDWRIRAAGGGELGSELDVAIRVTVGCRAASAAGETVSASLTDVLGADFDLALSIAKTKADEPKDGGLPADYALALRAGAVCDREEKELVTNWIDMRDDAGAHKGWLAEYTTVQTVTVTWPEEQMSIAKAGVS